MLHFTVAKDTEIHVASASGGFSEYNHFGNSCSLLISYHELRKHVLML